MNGFTFVLFVVICCFSLLEWIQKRSEELACASGEQVESVSNLGNKAALGSKGSSTMAHQFPSVNSSDVVYTDECDTSVAILNIVCYINLFK